MVNSCAAEALQMRLVILIPFVFPTPDYGGYGNNYDSGYSGGRGGGRGKGIILKSIFVLIVVRYVLHF